MDLTSIIIDRILQEGPISFHDFMELALYHPALGYYTSGQARIGANGDFITSPHLSGVIGMALGRQIEEMWRRSGEKYFTIVEYGAGEGYLCHDILDHLTQNTKHPERLRYFIIEKSAAMRGRQKAHLPAQVAWYDDIRELPPFCGCVLSNELLDNFAVHRVVMEDSLQEVFIDYRNGFKEVLRPAKSSLVSYFNELGVVLSPGYQTEVNLEAIDWMASIGERLQKGYVITIDYGCVSEELYHNRRRRGTLLCYQQQTINEDYYAHIGQQDITAHVNFSALRHWGQQYGLSFSGLITQAAFLLAMGFKDCLRKTVVAGESQWKAAYREAMLTRTLLLDMGMRFKVLIQNKGMAGKKIKCLALDALLPHSTPLQ